MDVSSTINHIAGSCLSSEYGDIRSMLDEYMPIPCWSEQVAMAHYLTVNVHGAIFSYDGHEGWTYEEEES